MKPIAWYDPSNGAVSTDKDSPLFTSLGQVWPLYAKEEWVSLTDEEHMVLYTKADSGLHDWAKAIEAKLKEKNQ